MTFTREELAWAAARMLAYGTGALLLLAITVIITLAITVTFKDHRKSAQR